METKTVERNWGLDLLRILAAFTVVMLHVSPQAYLDVEIASAPWNVMNVITGLCCWNVSAFFMLSGAFLLAPQKAMSTRTLYRKNIARLAAAFVFWSAVYALTYCLLRGKGKWTFLNELLRGHYHMWFVFTLISLYAVVPLLRKITESKKATEYFLLIGFLFTYLIGRALNFALLFELPHKDVLQSLQSAYAQLNPYRGLTALYAFVLGHYLMAYPLPKAARRLLCAAGCLSCLMTIWLTRWHSAVLQATSSVFTSGASLGVLTMTAALFVFFKELRLTPGAKAQRALLLVSKCTFGVYLVHALVLERLDIAYPVAAGALLLQKGPDRAHRHFVSLELPNYPKVQSCRQADMWSVELSVPYSFLQEVYGPHAPARPQNPIGNFYQCSGPPEERYGCWMATSAPKPANACLTTL